MFRGNTTGGYGQVVPGHVGTAAGVPGAIELPLFASFNVPLLRRLVKPLHWFRSDALGGPSVPIRRPKNLLEGVDMLWGWSIRTSCLGESGHVGVLVTSIINPLKSQKPPLLCGVERQ
jgi:hypothetical protein